MGNLKHFLHAAGYTQKTVSSLKPETLALLARLPQAVLHQNPRNSTSKQHRVSKLTYDLRTSVCL